MLPNGDLPIILVSAGSKSAAAKIISDIIDNEVTEMYWNQNISQCRVWRITNKYYTADVCLQPFTDDDTSSSKPDNIEALVIYLTEDECAIERCEARARRAGAAGHVRLLAAAAAECGAVWDALASAAARLRLELVPLRQDTAEAEEEECGVGRVRAALHAHVWPGLTLAAAAPHYPFSPLLYRERSGSITSSGGESEGAAGESEEEEEAVERAEAFAEALGAVGGAAQQCAALQGSDRLRQAELLVAAFCRALGHPLDV